MYYHQIDRSVGIFSCRLNIYYDDEMVMVPGRVISNWKQLNNQWELIVGSASITGTPLSYAYANDWDTFTDVPYILE